MREPITQEQIDNMCQRYLNGENSRDLSKLFHRSASYILYTLRRQGVTIRTLSQALKGKPKSKEHREHLSKALKGIITGEKNPNFGNHLSAEAKERISKANSKHGHAKGQHRPASPTYVSWRSMFSRCYRPMNDNYKNYGALGITICERWRDFQNFLKDMGERPDGMTIDRINPDGNYEPTNCRWANALTQRHNRRTP